MSKNLLCKTFLSFGVVLAFIATVILTGCGENNNPPPPPPPTITSVSVSPTSATVQVRLTQQFTVTVKGTGDFDPTYNLYINDVMSGNGTVGTIDISALYTAPSVVPNPATVTVKACSRMTGYTDVCGTASVTVTAPPPPQPFLAYARVRPTVCATCEDIWKVHLDANGLPTDTPIQLTTDPLDGMQPSVSPDGTKIAYISYATGSNTVFVMNADGSGQEQVPNGISWALWPIWSPDGKKIAFIGKFADDTVGIATMNPDGTGVLQLTSDASCPSGGSCKYPDRPTWSPDSKRIAYTRIDGMAATINSVDGSNPVALPTPQGTVGLSWSHDGNWIAFEIVSSTDSGQEEHLGLIHPDGSGFIKFGQLGYNPTWSQDSSRIIFVNSPSIGAYPELFVIKTDGTGLALVVGDSISMSMDPSWWGPH